MTLKAIRVNNGWSQEKASKLYGVSVDTVKNYESYKTFPDVPIIENILKATKMKYDDIIFLPRKSAKNVQDNWEKLNKKNRNDSNVAYYFKNCLSCIYFKNTKNIIWNSLYYNKQFYIFYKDEI